MPSPGYWSDQFLRASQSGEHRRPWRFTEGTRTNALDDRCRALEMRADPTSNPMRLMNHSASDRCHSVVRFHACRQSSGSGHFERLATIASLALLVFFILPSIRAQSDTGSVEGRILNPVSGNFIGNAQVSVKGTTRVTLSDSTGAYTLSDLPEGPVILRVKYIGKAEQEAAVTVEKGRTIRQDFSLLNEFKADAAGAVVMSEFTVAATRESDANAIATAEQRYAPNIKNVIAADAFGDVSEGNVGEFLKLIPGVAVNNAAGDASTISLRGMPSNYTPLLIDGNRVASASSSNQSRTIDLEQVSITNVARVEVTKTPIPSMWADSLGGTINLVGKSAFERSKPQFIARGVLQFSADTLTLKKTPGPGPGQTYKIRPGYDFSYIRPVSKTFGFTLSVRHSDQFGRDRTALATWEFLPANGGSETNPFYRNVQFRDDSRQTVRDTYGFTADWKPIPALVLSASFQHNLYDLRTQPARIMFDAAVRPASYGATFTESRAAAASITHSVAGWWDKTGTTEDFGFSAKYKKNAWKIDFNGAYSDSNNHYRDADHGFFRFITDSIPGATLRYDGFDGVNKPAVVTVRGADGQEIDWRLPSSYRMTSATSNVRDGRNIVSTARLDVRRSFELNRIPFSIQIGGALQQEQRDTHTRDYVYSFIGADGRAGTADDFEGMITDTNYVGQDAHFGWGRTIQWPDMKKLYDLYKAHPEYFVLNDVNLLQTSRNNSEFVKERISAAYVQLDASLLENKLKFIAGARLERTGDKGEGLKLDQNGFFQRDPSGAFVRDAAGNRIALTNDLLERAKLQYIERGARSSKDYQSVYPSANASYDITDNVMMRLGYSKTLGRPDFTNILPKTNINESAAGGTGTISLRNAGLKPWTADNYDVSLEWYFSKTGLVSAGVFHKDIVNAFGSVTRVIDDATVAEFGLDPIYRGWNLTSMFNLDKPASVNGFELNYQQQVGNYLPPWGRGLSIFANGTLFGHVENFTGFAKESYNWGVSYNRSRVSLALNWKWRKGQRTGDLTFAPGAGTYSSNNTALDVTAEYRFTKNISAFFAARNAFSIGGPAMALSPNSPYYSRATTLGETFAKCSVGIKATY